MKNPKQLLRGEDDEDEIIITIHFIFKKKKVRLEKKISTSLICFTVSMHDFKRHSKSQWHEVMFLFES